MPDIEKRPGLAKRIASASWRDLVVVGLPTVLVAAAAVAVAVKAARFAPPKTIHFASGPDGSSYRNQAEKYQKILARDGVKVEIIETRGALDNLDKLANPAVRRSTSGSCRAGWPRAATCRTSCRWAASTRSR